MNRSVSFSVRKGSSENPMLPRFAEEDNNRRPTQDSQYVTLSGYVPQTTVSELTTHIAALPLVSNNNTTEWTASQPTSMPYGSARVSMIQDLQGREWWNRSFGEVLMVEWPRFMMHLTKEFPTELTNTQSAIELQTILGNN